MARCCIRCFTDSVLIEAASRGGIGNCTYCDALRVPTVSSDTLFSAVELLLYSLEVSPEGEELFVLLETKFGIINPAVVKDKKRLTQEIFGEEIVSQRYMFKFDVGRYSSQWTDFKEELKHKNRFFPKNTLISQVLSPAANDFGFGVFLALLEQLKSTVDKGGVLFRARISETPLLSDKMGGSSGHDCLWRKS